MDFRLKNVEIKNFRSIESVVLDLNPCINVLAGPNGGGKSNILKAISRLSPKYYEPRQADQPRFSEEAFTLEAVTFEGRSFDSFTDDLLEAIFWMDASRAYPNEAQIPRTYLPQPDGSDLAGILLYYKGSVAAPSEFEMLLQRVKNITPEIDDVLPRFVGSDTAHLYVKCRRGDDTYDFDAKSMSLGSLDAVFLVLAIQLFRPGSVFLLDSPDSHLHAASQESMMQLLREVSEKEAKQFILASHSVHLVDLCSTEELFLVTREGFRTKVEKVSDKKEIIEALERTDSRLSDFVSSIKSR